MLILVPYFGDYDRFAPVLKKWEAAYIASGTGARCLCIGTGSNGYDLAGYDKVIRPDQPFDIKGALVCAALIQYPDESLLMLDADAFIACDPAATLEPFAGSPIAMPPDDGAVCYYRAAMLSEPFAMVQKLCAGVMWFGATGNRAELVSAYFSAFEELLALPALPWQQQLPHLVEQYAWSIVAHRMGGAVLPRSMNWNPDLLGHSDGAIINHLYGLRKWRR